MKKSLLACLISAASVGANANLMITGVYDGPLSGGTPKGVELYAFNDIPDLSIYGLGSANNGDGSDGQEFTFPSVAVSAGQYLYVASEDTGFTSFFGFAPDYTTSAMAINGDDAVELFEDDVVVDLFGDINVDGSGQAWDHLDGWAFRLPETQRNTIFTLEDWQFSGTNALDGESTNASAANPVPLISYTGGNGGGGGGGGGGTGPEETTFISTIQGNPDTYLSNPFGETDVSPLVDEVVKVRAVVVGDFQNNDADEARDLGGFYLQEEVSDEDGNPLSSEGIFVYDPNTTVDVALGDVVELTATVDQYFGETQLTLISDVSIVDTNQLSLVSPATISLSSNTEVSVSQGENYQAELEAYEGMLAVFTDTLAISEQFQLDRFNEIRLFAGERPRQFTQDFTPNAEMLDQHLRGLGARSVVYDDGLSQQNSSVSLLDGFANFSEATSKRMGDEVSGLKGIVDYKWVGNSASQATWRIRSVNDGDNIFTSTFDGNSPNPRPSDAPDVGGTVKVSSFNVLNFFTTIDTSGATTAAGHDPRGADTAEELARQTQKLVNALLELDADVLGLVELENEFDGTNDGSTAIEVLVNAVNEVAGPGTYDYVYPGQSFVGTDAIAVGVIYKPSVVALAEGSSPALLDDEIAATLDVFSSRDFDSDPIFNGNATNRVSLAVSFTHIISDDTFTLVTNHFKSKGSSGLDDSSSPNFDQGNGAGFWNQRRLDAAVAVKSWLATSPTGVSDDDQIILGDLNAYAMEDPIQYLLGNGFVNVEEEGAYSYVFDGQVGTLDYLLISDALSTKLSGAAIWNINADEADAIDYNLDFGREASYYNGASPLRSSDHDPVIIGLNLEAQEPDVNIDQILTFYTAGLTNETIRGRGLFAFTRWLRESYYFSLLLGANASFEQANMDKACSLLAKTRLYSDEQSRPTDIIVGSGVGELNAKIQSVENEACSN